MAPSFPRFARSPFPQAPGAGTSTRSAYDAVMTVADPGTVLAELQSSDRLLVQQVFKPIANEYRISIPSPGSGEEGRPLLYVKQKKMKIKEDIRFRVSPDDEAHLFMIKSKSVFEFRGRHEGARRGRRCDRAPRKGLHPLTASQPLARA